MSATDEIEVVRSYEPDDDRLRALLRVLVNERGDEACNSVASWESCDDPRRSAV
jgi:hypothetical protein